MPLASGPLAVAGRGTRGAPQLVVGANADDDLMLARSLLSSILAAVADSEPGLGWAVGVLRARAGQIVVVSSTEGLGWLPSGLFLPAEVTVPSKWAGVFGPSVQDALVASEGIVDPARVFGELSAVIPGKSRFRVSALASSAVVPDNVRAALGDRAVIEGEISAAEPVIDLTTPAPGLVDRFELAGSEALHRRLSAVAESDIRETCMALASAAHDRVCDVLRDTDQQTVEHRAQRRTILDTLRAGGVVSPAWVDDMRATDAMMAAAQRSRRVDVSHLPIGTRTEIPGTEIVRRMFFERRADELLMLLAAGEPDQRLLREVFYAYGQITEHPGFPSEEATVPVESRVSEVSDVRRGNSVSAQPAVAAPPRIESTIVEDVGPKGSELQRST